MKLRACATLAMLIGVSGCSLVRGGERPPSRSTTFEQALQASDAGDISRQQHLLATVAAICPTDGLGRRASLLLAASELDPRNRDGRPDVAARIAAVQATRRTGEKWMRALAEELYLHALNRGAEPVTDEGEDLGVFWTAYALGYPQVGEAEEEGDAPAARAAAAEAGDAPPQEAAPQDDERRVIARTGPRCKVAPRDTLFALPELPGESLASRLARLQGAARPDQPAQQVPADVAALQAEVRQLRASLEEKEQELSRIRRTLRP